MNNILRFYKYDSNSLEFKKIPTITSLSKLLLITLIFTILTILILSSSEIKTTIEEIPILIHKNQHFISKERLEEKLIELNISHREIVIAQALLESSHFTSPIFKNNNNIFGMKKATTRPTTAIGTQLNHAIYKDWESSVLDYALWQTSFARNLTEDEYLNLLDKIYAEDKKYKDKISTILKDIRNENI